MSWDPKERTFPVGLLRKILAFPGHSDSLAEGYCPQQLLEQGLKLWGQWREHSEEREMEQRGRGTVSADHAAV